MEVLTEVPKQGAFVPLAEHQSATPASFYSGPPVLHYFSDRCKVVVLESELSNAPALSSLFEKIASTTQENATEHTNGDVNGEQPGQKMLEDIDVWVTSDKLLVYSPSHETGISIPYPTIALHAIQSLPEPAASEPQSQGLYMQLIPSVSASADDEEPPDTVSVTIIPTASAPPPATITASETDEPVASEGQPEQTPVMALFTALSNCSNLHPDPIDEDEEGGGGSRLMQAGLAIPGTTDGTLPPPMPGSGGWITADNMHEYVDEEGNWIGGDDEEMADGETPAVNEELGPGAGTVRSRDEDGVNGNGDNDDSKWQRTS